MDIKKVNVSVVCPVHGYRHVYIMSDCVHSQKREIIEIPVRQH